MIPKIIHQTWKDYSIPEKYKILSDEVKNLNQDFEYRFWTDDDCLKLLKSDYPKMLNKLSTCSNNGEKADIFRYCILHKFGGVYLDLDYQCFRKLSEVSELNQIDLFLCYDDELSFKYVGLHNVITNSIMGCAPGSYFFEKVLKSLESESFHKIYLRRVNGSISKIDITLSRTGPILVTNVYNAFKTNLKSVYIGPNYKFVNRHRIIKEQFGSHKCYHSWFESS